MLKQTPPLLAKVLTNSQEFEEVRTCMSVLQKLMNVTTPSNIQILSYFSTVKKSMEDAVLVEQSAV